MTPVATAEPVTLHSAHCYADRILTCGWPKFHARSCWLGDCERAKAAGLPRCRDCSARLLIERRPVEMAGSVA